MLPIDHLYRGARRNPGKVAVIDGGRSLTYAELVRRVDALAAAWQAIDPAPQSRVGVCATNTTEHLLAWLATLAAGKTWVPLNPRNGRDELARMIAATGPSIIAADADCLDKVAAGGATVIIGRDGAGKGSLDGLMTEHDGRRPVRPALAMDDLQAIKFTGGSSGRPKGCLQTYRVWNTCVGTMMASFAFDEDDRHLIATPMTHGSNTLILPILSAGGTQVFMGPASPAGILDAFEAHAITSLFLPPTVVYMMMAEPGVGERRFPSLRHVIVGGAGMRTEQVRQAIPLFNHALEMCFGQTEAPQIATCIRAADWRDERNLASCGRPTLLTEVAIMGADGNPLPTGESGEIVIRGDLVMKGYLDMPEETARTIVDGWLHTGDVGLIDGRGYVFIKDRIRDVIISGGFNVYPSDVEAVIGEHPSVKECVVFAVDDDKWGEAVHAAVETVDGAAADEAVLIAFVKERLDSVKAPKRIHFTPELPRSPVGKVLRREAKAMFSE